MAYRISPAETIVEYGDARKLLAEISVLEGRANKIGLFTTADIAQALRRALHSRVVTFENALAHGEGWPPMVDPIPPMPKPPPDPKRQPTEAEDGHKFKAGGCVSVPDATGFPD